MGKPNVRAAFDKDSRRYHRFIIDEGQGIVGMLYVPREEEVLDMVEVRLMTKANEAEGTG